ncbi:hypothetical protein [Streptomyces griseorubiginosus]|uniref:hypothetical protein n=1 Tax=Streptomyces griseorubiginosus TaxID=67304 RepID=UPI0036E381B4
MHDQARHRGVLYEERTGRPYGEVRPDVLVTGTVDGEPLCGPVDVKYKLYDSRPGSPPTCVLIHPGSVSATRGNIAVRRWDGTSSARVRSVSLHRPSVLGALGDAERDSTLAKVWAAVLA